MKIIEKISVLGDSISKGVILDEISKRYKIIKDSAAELFSRENNIVVQNHAKFGCTSEKALAITRELLEREDQSGIILLELGGNDCDFNWDDVAAGPEKAHKPNVGIENFKQNISKIIKMVLDKGRRMAVMTLPPIDSDKYFNWITRGDKSRAENIMRFLGDKNRIYRQQELYAHELEYLAAENHIFRIPVRAEFLTIPKYSDYICDDGIHLNELGQAKMNSILSDTYKKYVSA